MKVLYELIKSDEKNLLEAIKLIKNALKDGEKTVSNNNMSIQQDWKMLHEKHLFLKAWKKSFKKALNESNDKN